MYITTSRGAKLFFLSVMYLAQGLPWGFVSVALTGYMYEQGMSTGEVGSLMAMAMWPWPFKWILGPIIDRWGLLSMGRRRPWIILAQGGMVLSTLTILSVPDITSEVKLLGLVLMFHNCFVAMQDVGVDALAVDSLKGGEREKANALMFASSHIGTFVGSAGLGYVIGVTNLHVGLWVLAGLQIGILTLPLLLRERPGEKLLPWTKGEAHAEVLAIDNSNLPQLARRVLRAFTLRTTILGVVLAVTVMIGMMMTSLVFQRYVIQDVTPEIFRMVGDDEVKNALDRGEIPDSVFDQFRVAGYEITSSVDPEEAMPFFLRLFSRSGVESPEARVRRAQDEATAVDGGEAAEWEITFGNQGYLVREGAEWTVHRSWTQARYSLFSGTTVVTAVIAALFGGFLGSRFGVKKIASIGTVLLGGTWMVFAFILGPQVSDGMVVLFMHVDQFFTGLLTVALWAMFMQISWPVVAATQFTAFMALLNVSRIIGSQFAGSFEEYMGSAAWAIHFAGRLQIETVPVLLLVAGCIQISILSVILLIDPTQTRRVLGDLDQNTEKGDLGDVPSLNETRS